MGLADEAALNDLDLSIFDHECVRIRMLFEFKGIEVLGRCLDDAVELALDSMSARITAYMVSRMVSEISSSLHFMRSTPEPDSELRPISSLKIRRLAFEIEQPRIELIRKHKGWFEPRAKNLTSFEVTTIR